jgi:hypothetical protein
MLNVWPASCVALILSSGLALQSPEEFARADLATRRLAPSAIPGLPTQVRQALERRGCTIPQLSSKSVPHNAVRGAFTAPKRIEWAVLCSRAKTSSILVLGESSGTLVAQFAERPDVMSLQRAGPWGIVFSREVSAAMPETVRMLRQRETGRAVPSINHDGIRDDFVDKYAVVWYRDGKTWLRIPGSD